MLAIFWEQKVGLLVTWINECARKILQQLFLSAG
uniref:Uncharacterized protein n=1 Tax=Anguilla anguilla TaxID=7936 RepID=A0A0E9PKP9_ANGAN